MPSIRIDGARRRIGQGGRARGGQAGDDRCPAGYSGGGSSPAGPQPRAHFAVTAMTAVALVARRWVVRSPCEESSCQGVFRPRSDTWLLARAASARRVRAPAYLELCAGPAFAGIAAAGRRAPDDGRRLAPGACQRAHQRLAERRADRGTARRPLHRGRGRALRLDPGQRRPTFPDLHRPLTAVLARPTPTPTAGRSWTASARAAPAHLNPGGTILLVHSEVCDSDATLAALAAVVWTSTWSHATAGHSDRCCPRVARSSRRAGDSSPGQQLEDVLVLRGRQVGRTSARWPIPTP